MSDEFDPRIPVKQEIVMPEIMREFEKLRTENERLKDELDAVGRYANVVADDTERLKQDLWKCQEQRDTLLTVTDRDKIDRLRATLEKIATDYYHDQHAIWAAEALRHGD